ncbi:hypothetical protein U1Q18_008293, partial [Sarracenia purpurea var. burkii]
LVPVLHLCLDPKSVHVAAATSSTFQEPNRTLREHSAANCFNLTHLCSYGVNSKSCCRENLLVPSVVAMPLYGLFVENPNPVGMPKFRGYVEAHLDVWKLRCAEV